MKSNSKLSIMSAAAILSLGAGEANARDVEPLVYYTGFEAPTYKLGALGHQDEGFMRTGAEPRAARPCVSGCPRQDGGATRWCRVETAE